MPGIITSSRTISHWPRSQISSAAGPLAALTTSKYSAPSRASSRRKLAGTSSTTSTRALISVLFHEMAHSLEKLGNRNRFRQIGLATTLADALLITFHGKGGDGNDGNGAQLVVLLDPFGDFQPGY